MAYGSIDRQHEEGGGGGGSVPRRANSLPRSAAQGPDAAAAVPLVRPQDPRQRDEDAAASSDAAAPSASSDGLRILVYALINVIIAVPGLYGYAAVIFNHECFGPHMAALSKLVVFSSLVHQLGFTLFSSLDFAIGTVQDAGLIFLSAMSHTLATTILDAGGSVDEVVSTTLVVLPLGTAALGLVLILLGKFRLLDVVSYLPLPVIGGYLAFIGYFCLQAGVALCVSRPLARPADWLLLLDPRLLLLAAPGLLSAALLAVVSRRAAHDAALPLAMAAVPAAFYLALALSGTSLDAARDAGWVGATAPPVPVGDLLGLVDFRLVHWSLAGRCVGTWVGMVFVVSFASCLDIAAVSMDMGEALDTNAEMVTVGTANLMSGLTFGFTGSYIFSQTIFTYRTGCHSRWVGVFIMAAYLAVCVSTVNLLQIAPLFFLGATLIFIGYDLLWEWLIDIRAKIFFMEYVVLLVTFVAIQIVGMDFGIIFGVVVALIEHVAYTTRVSSLERVAKRSRAVWSNDEWAALQTHGYTVDAPKIVTLELKGPIFFGSSQKLLHDIVEEIGLSISSEEITQIALASPHTSTPLSSVRARRVKRSPSGGTKKKQANHQDAKRKIHPHFVVLDFTQVHNLDASAATSCFLQLAKMCEKRGILLSACGAVPRVEWMLRSHDIAYEFNEEIQVKKDVLLLSKQKRDVRQGKLLLFLTVFEALEFSERLLIERVTTKMPFERLSCLQTGLSTVSTGFPHHEVTYIFLNVLRGDLNADEKTVLDGIPSYYKEAKYLRGDTIFKKNTHPDAFYIVVSGAVAIPRDRGGAPSMTLSGVGATKRRQSLSSTNLIGMIDEDGQQKSVESFHKVGGIFGYCDYMLERRRMFEAVAASDEGAMVAVFTRMNLDRMKSENGPMYGIVQKLLLRASLSDLANCTCHN